MVRRAATTGMAEEATVTTRPCVGKAWCGRSCEINKLSRFAKLRNKVPRRQVGAESAARLLNVRRVRRTEDWGSRTREANDRYFWLLMRPCSTRRRRSGAHRDPRVTIASRRPGRRSATPQTNTLPLCGNSAQQRRHHHPYLAHGDTARRGRRALLHGA
jgi:hypothetical protein